MPRISAAAYSSAARDARAIARSRTVAAGVDNGVCASHARRGRGLDIRCQSAQYLTTWFTIRTHSSISPSPRSPIRRGAPSSIGWRARTELAVTRDRRAVRGVAAGGHEASRRAGARRPDRAREERPHRALPPARRRRWKPPCSGCPLRALLDRTARSPGRFRGGGTMLTKPSLTLKRRLKATPAQVFSAWTDPEKIVHWFGPNETMAGSVRAEMDVRVGRPLPHELQDRGRRAPRGRRRLPRGRARQPAGVHLGLALDARARVARHRDRGRGRRRHACSRCMHEQFFDEKARDGHQRGWTGTLEKLERYLS